MVQKAMVCGYTEVKDGKVVYHPFEEGDNILDFPDDDESVIKACKIYEQYHEIINQYEIERKK